MTYFIRALSVLLLTIPACFAQLVIENTRHLKIPEDQVQALLRMSCQAVGNELHLQDKAKFNCGLRLVLGEKEEHFGLDMETGMPTLSLSEWNVEKFTSAAVTLAIQRSIDPHREQEMILEILRRFEQIAPVSATQLHDLGYSDARAVQGRNDCIHRISDASVRNLQCNAIIDDKRSTAK